MAGSLFVAFAITLALRPLLNRTVFVFMYGAVAAAAVFGGVVPGVLAAVASVLLVDYFVLEPRGTLAFKSSEDVTSIVAFLIVSAVISLMARSLRRSREVAERSAHLLEEQTREMLARQVEAESLAADLEQSTVELETAMEDANESRNLAVANEERLRLLDEAGRVLASSLDYETTVAAVARLAVPKFADWCGVDLLVNGRIEQIAIAHVDPEKTKWARDLNAKYPVDVDAPAGVPLVIRTGEPQFIPTVTDAMLVAAARDEDHLRVLREIGIYSAVVVPMTARGQTLGAITLISSNPERRFDEADLALMSQLGRRAAMAIDNARLYRAALVANEAKANFLATMSHELRTPLTAIIGYEELLAEGISGPVSEPQLRQLQRIKMSAGHLLTLIDEILLYARVEAGRESVRIESVVAKGVVDDAMAFVAPVASERGLTLHADGIDPGLLLRTDAGKLRQMILNLVANAVKFTQNGTITARAFPDGDRVVFEVQDTGIGIASENLSQVFEPFWQVDQNTTRQAGGSGLGLTVTKRLAELLGGEITVSSEPGRGSTFRIVLPKERPAISSAIAASRTN